MDRSLASGTAQSVPQRQLLFLWAPTAFTAARLGLPALAAENKIKNQLHGPVPCVLTHASYGWLGRRVRVPSPFLWRRRAVLSRSCQALRIGTPATAQPQGPSASLHRQHHLHSSGVLLHTRRFNVAVKGSKRGSGACLRQYFME